MTPFRFETTPRIIAEVGATAMLGEVMAGLGCHRVALITDETVLSLGLAEAALEGLRAAGLAPWVYAAVTPDPPEAVILEATEGARWAGVDGVVALGGGSSLDTGKLVAALAASSQPLADMYGVGRVTGRRLPLALVPTTAGTGSEVTPIAIVTTGAAEKMGVVSPALLPDCAVLDAELTIGLPAPVTAATGIDAMVHAIEAYTSRHRKNPVSDCLAREALTLLAGNIRTACETPQDRAARSAMLIGSTLAGMAFANAPVAAVHALAYPLGGHFHVPHGLSNALVLPHVLDFNMPAAEGLYAELAPLAFPGLNDGARGFVERLGRLGPTLGLPATLSEVGVKEADLPNLASAAMRQTRLLVNNPRGVAHGDALAIYQAAL